MSAPISIAWIDGADLAAATPRPIEWLIEGLLPAGTAGDIFGPPNEGKTSLLLSLALHIATGAREWFGRRIVGGQVLLLGGEKSGRDVWERDYHRAAGGLIAEPGRLIIAPAGTGPMWIWTRDGWETTDYYRNVVDYAQNLCPVLTLCDTIGRVALGQNPVDIPQQQMLANCIERFRDEIGGTVLTISHTNQASRHDDLYQRLDWTSRAGSSGLPGHVRWIMGMTRMTDQEAAEQLGHDPRDPEVIATIAMRKLIAVAISKHNEMPEPRGAWNRRRPAILEMMQDGSIMAIPDGERQKSARAYADASQTSQALDQKNTERKALAAALGVAP